MFKASLRRILPVVLALAAGLGISHYAASLQTTPPATLHGDKAHPARTMGWVDTELYFGLGPADDPGKGVSEAGWRAFLDEEVTPRFPDGLSVMDIYGQWQGKHQTTPERIRSKMLVILYPGTRENDAKIEAIRIAWKKKTGDQSVLKVTKPASVSF